MTASKNQVKPPLRWRMKHVSSPNTSVPARGGLYAIGHDEACLGLESERVYVYIGMTDNLRRRLKQHSPVNEQKLGLRKYLQDNVSTAKYWYAVVDKESEGSLAEMEGQLLHRFAPKYNDKGKPRKESD